MAGEPERVAAARRLLAELGIHPAELIGSIPARSMPTVGAFLVRVRAAATAPMLRTYGTYWDRLEQGWATRPLDSVVASDILAWMRQLQAGARRRGARRDGRHAAAHGLHALRNL
jgi:integrase/recombinase XerC